MSFEWNRIHKWEENHERSITDDVFEYVCEAYGVSEVSDLTEEQVAEIEAFSATEISEFSVMQIGFSNVLREWEYANEG